MTHIKVRRRADIYVLAMDRVAAHESAKTAGGGAHPHLSSVLETLPVALASERIDLEMISHFLGQRSIAGLLLFLALPMALPIPAPGISVVFGIPLILVSAQLLLGRRSVWLPRRLARRSITRGEFTALVARLLPGIRALERIVRPRLCWMAGDWAAIPLGAVCLVLALIITLPIPLGHMVPGAAISVLALGLIERDGLAVGLGLLAALLGLVIVTLASSGLLIALQAWFAP